jgi:iron(III) transport system permease protein
MFARDDSLIGTRTRSWQRWLWGGVLLIGSTSLLLSGRGAGLLWNTAVLAMAVAALSLPLGLAAGFVLARTDIRGKKFAASLLAALLFMPLYLTVAGWEAGLGRQGWLVALLAPYQNSAPLVGWRGAIWAHTMHVLPWVIGILHLGATRIPPSHEEHAFLEGSPAQVFRHVTLRHLAPFLAAAAAWIAVTVAVEITVTDVYQIRTFAEELYLGYVQGESALEVQLRLLPSLLVMVTLLLLSLTTIEQLVPAARFHAPRDPVLWQLGRYRSPASILVGGLLLGCLMIPVANLLYHAGIQVDEVAGERFRSWSLPKCLSILGQSPWRFRREFAWSLLLAQLSSITSIAVAVPWALWSRRGGWPAGFSFLLVAILFALPGPVMALGIIRLLNQPDSSWCIWLYDQTVVAPCLAMVLRSLPLIFVLLWLAVRTIPTQLFEAARLDGATRWQLLVYVVRPEMTNSLVCAWLLGMAISLGELSASILVMPPGVTTISLRIFGLVHYGVEDQLAGLCLTSVALLVGLAAALQFTVRQLTIWSR